MDSIFKMFMVRNTLIEYDQVQVSYNRMHKKHSGYGLSQRERLLQCNCVSHWLSPYPESSLYTLCKKQFSAAPQDLDINWSLGKTQLML